MGRAALTVWAQGVAGGAVRGGRRMWQWALGGVVDVTVAYLQRCPPTPECPGCSLNCPACPSFTRPPPASVSCPACPALACPAAAAESRRPAREDQPEWAGACPACPVCERPARAPACDTWGAFLRGAVTGVLGGGCLAFILVKVIGYAVGGADLRRGPSRGAIGF